MGNGLGEYFGSAAMQAPPQSPAGVGAPTAFESPIPPTRTTPLVPSPRLPQTSGLGEYFSQNGMGAFNLGPVPTPRQPGAFRKVASRVSPFAGALGDVSDVISDTRSGMITGVAAATTLTGILFAMGLRFGAGWLVGKAVAPSAKDEKLYTWGGAIASMLFGSIGLGVEALVAQNARK